MPAPAAPQAYRHIRSVSRGGSGCAAYLFAILGLGIAFLSIASGQFIGLILAVVLIAIAALAEPKKQRIAICGACGNEVTPTSLICPTCHAKLTTAPRRLLPDAVTCILILTTLSLAAFFLWLNFRS